MTDEVTMLLQNAVQARKDSLQNLRERIATLLAPIPIGAKLYEDNGSFLCEVHRIYTGASQWANTTWEVTIKGIGYVTTGQLLIAVNCDQSHYDGNNMHTRSTEPYVLHLRGDDDCENESDYRERNMLHFASGKDTRDVATKLPAAIAKYMEECKQEQEANDATLPPTHTEQTA